MNITPATPPYDYQQHHTREERLPSIKHMFESIDQQQSSVHGSAAPIFTSQPPSPPDLLYDLEEADENSLRTPSISSSPRQELFLNTDHDLIYNKNRSADSHGFVRPIILPPPHTTNRRKSVPHRSPSIDVYQASAYDRSVVFQLNSHLHKHNMEYFSTIKNNYTPANQSCPDCGDTCDFKCTSKVICGQSLLSALRKKVADARSLNQQSIEIVKYIPRRNNKRVRTASIIEIPRQHHQQQQQQQRRDSCISHNSSTFESSLARGTITTQAPTLVVSQPHRRPWVEETHVQQDQKEEQQDRDYEDQHQVKRVKKSSPRRQYSSGRPSKVKGPCQACHEASDGCMRKAFNWPFPASQIFNDKGTPFVYLCNKCGLR